MSQLSKNENRDKAMQCTVLWTSNIDEQICESGELF